MITLPEGLSQSAVTKLLIELDQIDAVRDALDLALDAQGTLDGDADAVDKALAQADADQAVQELKDALRRYTRQPSRPVLTAVRAA